MRLVIFAAVILFGLCTVFAGEKPCRIYTNQDLEKYKTNPGSGSVPAKSFRHAGFSRCYELDSMSAAQLKSFLAELDSMQEHYSSKSVSDEEKQGILKSIKTCREKVETKLRTVKDHGGQRVQNHVNLPEPGTVRHPETGRRSFPAEEIGRISAVHGNTDLWTETVEIALAA